MSGKQKKSPEICLYSSWTFFFWSIFGRVLYNIVVGVLGEAKAETAFTDKPII